MLNINITKELNSEKSKTERSNRLPQEGQKLLDGDHTRERNLLKKLNLGHDIIKAESAEGLNRERDTLEKTYGTSAYTTEEIKELAIDYDLKFLSTKSFNGSIDMKVSAKIREFFDNNNLNDMDDTERFYLLAPKSAFNFKDKKNPKTINPILFYRPNRGDVKYLMIYQWGNEFTIFRLLRGLVKRNIFTVFLSFFIMGFLVTNIILSFIGQYNPIIDTLWSFPGGFTGLLIGRMIFIGENFHINDLNEDHWQAANTNL